MLKLRSFGFIVFSVFRGVDIHARDSLTPRLLESLAEGESLFSPHICPLTLLREASKLLGDVLKVHWHPGVSKEIRYELASVMQDMLQGGDANAAAMDLE